MGAVRTAQLIDHSRMARGASQISIDTSAAKAAPLLLVKEKVAAKRTDEVYGSRQN